MDSGNSSCRRTDSFATESFIFKKIIKGIEIAKKLGAEIIGLGEFIFSITHAGEDLRGKVNGVSIINGKSLTTGVTFKAIEEISEIKKINLEKEKIAIVGAGGAVGKGVSLLLAEKGIPLILIDKDKKISELKKNFSSYNTIISNEISLIKNARIIIATSSTTFYIELPMAKI